MWMGHKVGRGSDGEQPFSGLGGRRKGNRNFLVLV
jgi:hypothetical protein